MNGMKERGVVALTVPYTAAAAGTVIYKPGLPIPGFHGKAYR
jgi:hypothetical protein